MPVPWRASPPLGDACSSCSRELGFNPPKPSHRPRTVGPEPRPAKGQGPLGSGERSMLLDLGTGGQVLLLWRLSCALQDVQQHPNLYCSIPLASHGSDAKITLRGEAPEGSKGQGAWGLHAPASGIRALQPPQRKTAPHSVTSAEHPAPGAGNPTVRWGWPCACPVDVLCGRSELRAHQDGHLGQATGQTGKPFLSVPGTPIP